jgi:hypothetical protein
MRVIMKEGNPAGNEISSREVEATDFQLREHPGDRFALMIYGSEGYLQTGLADLSFDQVAQLAARAQKVVSDRTLKVTLSEEQIEQQLAAQGGKCPACLSAITSDTCKVDADPASGVLRGLLCEDCIEMSRLFTGMPTDVFASLASQSQTLSDGQAGAA